MTERNFTKELNHYIYNDPEYGEDIETIDYESLISIIQELHQRIEKLEKWKDRAQSSAYSWLEPMERLAREIKKETQRMKKEIEKMKQESHNLPVPDDAPWLNLSQEEINQLRKQKQQLTEYGKQKLRKLMKQMEWEQIYNQISKSDDHIIEKVNTYNLTDFIVDLMIENSNLREKVEELQNDVEILKSYAWNNE